jgi:uncharacterized membrane protein YhiD involved in acid resistance
MAVGGGQFVLAIFATLLILGVLMLLGGIEHGLNLKVMLYAYEVSGPSAEETEAKVNEVLEPLHSLMLNTQIAPTTRHVRIHFECEGTRHHHTRVLKGLKESGAFESVVSLGPVQAE